MADEPKSSQAPKKFVLIAEDDKFYDNIYKVKFENEGYEVRVVTDGAQAVEEAKKRKPDIVLLDLVMPVKDGFETLKALKALPELKDVPMMVLSSLGQDDDAAKVKELGAVEYYVKTNITIYELVNKVKEYLGGTGKS